jgi:hypothetical protein
LVKYSLLKTFRSSCPQGYLNCLGPSTEYNRINPALSAHSKKGSPAVLATCIQFLRIGGSGGDIYFLFDLERFARWFQ